MIGKCRPTATAWSLGLERQALHCGSDGSGNRRDWIGRHGSGFACGAGSTDLFGSGGCVISGGIGVCEFLVQECRGMRQHLRDHRLPDFRDALGGRAEQTSN